MVVVAGHTWLKAARQLGLMSAPVHIAQWPHAGAAASISADGQPGERKCRVGETLLGLELDDLKGYGFDLGLTGFDDDELNRLTA
jgi:hypothetical protein